MAKYKFNFKDADCQYVEKYYAGKYNTPVTIYKTEGDENTPKGYFATVGTVEVKGDTIDEVRKNIDAEATKRDKKLENAIVMDKKCKDTDYVKTPRGEFKVVEKTEKELREDGYGYHHSSDDGKYKIFTKNNKAVAIKVKDSKNCISCNDYYDDLEDEWDYEINCEGNQWTDGGFETADEAEDEALAKVNELLEDFPEGYAVDDFDIIISNSNTGENYMYNPYDMRDGKGCVNCKDSKKKVRDADADEIINLFHEAYDKHRTWDWLKHKLPERFFTLYHKRQGGGDDYPLFPVQADRTGNLKGTFLTKPKNLSEKDEYKAYIREFISDLDYYIKYIDNIKNTYGLDINNYEYPDVTKIIENAIKNTDSKKESMHLETDLDTLDKIYRQTYDACNKLSNVDSFWWNSSDWAERLIDLGEEGLTKYIINRANKSFENKDYLENQRRPIIYNSEGDYIRSDSKVGPLTPEAEAYIRRILRNTSTEEIDAKKRARNNNFWTNNGNYRPINIKEYNDEIQKLKWALSELKDETRKESKLGINISPKKEGYYKYTGNGPYDYNGRWVGERKGGYEYTRETKPASVRFNMKGLENLEHILGKVLSSDSIEEMQGYLEDALDVIKTMPRSNPKVAEIRERINNILNNRRNAPKVRRPLPDAKYRDARCRDAKYRGRVLDLRVKR